MVVSTVGVGVDVGVVAGVAFGVEAALSLGVATASLDAVAEDVGSGVGFRTSCENSSFVNGLTVYSVVNGPTMVGTAAKGCGRSSVVMYACVRIYVNNACRPVCDKCRPSPAVYPVFAYPVALSHKTS